MNPRSPLERSSNDSACSRGQKQIRKMPYICSLQSQHKSEVSRIPNQNHSIQNQNMSIPIIDEYEQEDNKSKDESNRSEKAMQAGFDKLNQELKIQQNNGGNLSQNVSKNRKNESDLHENENK